MYIRLVFLEILSRGQIDPPPQKKLLSKSPALLGSKVQSYKSYNSKSMIASTQITNNEIFAFIVVLNRKDKRNRIEIVGMQNFLDTFETRKQSFISTFSICKTVSLIENFSFYALNSR